MNDMTLAAPAIAVLPVSLELPVASHALDCLIYDVRRGSKPQSRDGALRREAASIRTAYAAACQPVPARVLIAWLHTINLEQSVPIGRIEFAMRAGAIAELLSDMPVGVFTRESRNAAGSEMKYFPGAAEVKACLLSRAGKLWSTEWALRIIVELPDPEPPRIPLEREAALAMFHKIKMALLSASSPPWAVASSHAGVETG